MEMDALIVDALAVFRLTRLITEDKVTEKARDRFLRRFPATGGIISTDDGWTFQARGERTVAVDQLGLTVDVTGGVISDTDAIVLAGHPLGYLATCAWCVSPYIAVAVVCARRWAPAAWNPVAKVLAASAVAGIISAHT